jgi:hypothetical protein
MPTPLANRISSRQSSKRSHVTLRRQHRLLTFQDFYLPYATVSFWYLPDGSVICIHLRFECGYSFSTGRWNSRPLTESANLPGQAMRCFDCKFCRGVADNAAPSDE